VEISVIIIGILWAILSLLAIIEYAPVCKDLKPADKFAVGLIFIIGGPIFAAANILEALLDCFLPEGWGGDDSGQAPKL
jgi:hypothetical protein